MPSLLDLFILEKQEIAIYRLGEEGAKQLCEFFPKAFRESFISEAKLTYLAEQDGAPPRIALIQAKLPDRANIMAGDFCEVLFLHLLKEVYATHLLKGILKWRWKEDRNRSCGKSDVVLYCMKNGVSGSADDLVVVAEIKAKATKNKAYNPLEKAIEGSNEDYLRRLALTLAWAKDKYTEEGDFMAAKEMERFSTGASRVTYKKAFRAAAVIDQVFESEEIAKPIEPLKHEVDFSVVFVSVHELKKVYTAIFQKALET